MPKLIPIKDEAALVLDDGNLYKIQHKRQRKILSCVRCHRKKTKCDKEKPVCGNCMKYSAECVYFVNDRVSGTNAANFSFKEKNVQNMKNLQQELEMSISQTEKNNRTSQELSSHEQRKLDILAAMEESKKYQLLEQKIIEDSKKNKRTYTKKNGQKNGGVSKMKSMKAQSADFEELKAVEALRDLKESEKRIVKDKKFSSMVNQTSSLSSSYKINPSIPKIKVTKLVKTDNYPSYISKGKISEFKKITKTISSHANSLSLYERFLKSVHPVLPFLHLKNYQDDLRVFYNDLTVQACINYRFLLLLCFINYAALRSIYYDNSINGQDMPKLEQSMNIYKKYIHELISEHNKIPILTKFTIEVMLNSILENPKFTKIAELVRISEKLKLNKDTLKTPSNSKTPGLDDLDPYHKKHKANGVDNNVSQFEDLDNDQDLQLRRMLFWQLFELDTMSSLHNNLPPLIKTFEIPLLDEIDANGQLIPSICFLNAKYRFIIILNELCLKINSGTVYSLKERIVDLHACCTEGWLSLKRYKDGLTESNGYHNVTFPSVLSSTITSSADENKKSHLKDFQDDLNFIEWAMYNIQTFPDRALLLLHLNLIKISMPVLVERNRKLFEFGKHFLAIQSVLNDSGNLQLDGSSVYNYEDLTNNLIPASLHYLDEFNKITDIYDKEGWNSFNWELTNLPINAITFTLKTLTLDLNRSANNRQCYNLNNDLRYLLLKKSIAKVRRLIIIGQNKKQCICKMCFQLVELLFELLKIRYGLSKHFHSQDTSCEFYFNKYDIELQSIFNEGIVSQSVLIPQPAPAPIMNVVSGSMSRTSSSSFNNSPGSHRTSSSGNSLKGRSEITQKNNATRPLSSSPESPTLSNLNSTLNFNYQPSSNTDRLQSNMALPVQTSSSSINDILNFSTSTHLKSTQISPLSSSSSLVINGINSQNNYKSNLEESDSLKYNFVEKSDEYYNSMSLTKKLKKLQEIKEQVEKYILILNEDSVVSSSSPSSLFDSTSSSDHFISNSDSQYSFSSPGYFEHDDYFREYENAILEILSGILSMPVTP